MKKLYSYILQTFGYFALSVLLIAVACVLYWSRYSEEALNRVEYLILFSLLAIAAFFDLRDRIIPNRVVAAGFVLAFGMILIGDQNWIESFGAALGVATVLFGIRRMGAAYFGDPGIGMGDLKLFFVIALFTGTEVYWILYLAVMIAGLFSITGLFFGLLQRKTQLPFAPFIGLAVIAALWIPWEKVSRWLL